MSSLGSCSCKRPFLRLEQGVPGAEIYPPGVESRDAYVALQTEFAPGETTPIIILADVTGSPTDLANINALDAYAKSVDDLPHIDRVESPFVIHDPQTGALLTPEQVAALYACRRAATAGLGHAAHPRPVHGVGSAPSALPPSKPNDRSIPSPAISGRGGTAQVGGARRGRLLVSRASARTPSADSFASGFILFLLFGSVVPLRR